MSRRIAAGDLERWLLAVFQALGAPAHISAAVAESLLEAELAGHASHGLIRVSEYVRHVAEGTVVPAAEPRVLAENETQVHLECERAFGAYAAGQLTDRLAAKARQFGVAAGALRGAGHVGRAGDYPQRLAADGLAALALVNGGGKTPRVAPFGGRRGFLGTNPVAFAVPGPVNQPPIVVDFSTAAVASGKIRVLQAQGREAPDGWLLDSSGRPTRDPADYYAGGMLVTAAEHKGYGLSLIVDVLAGLVSGTGCPGHTPDFSGANGFFMLACSLDLFAPGDALRERISEWAVVLKEVPAVDPASPVCLAGEPEHLRRVLASREGVELAPALEQELRELSGRLGIAAP